MFFRYIMLKNFLLNEYHLLTILLGNLLLSAHVMFYNLLNFKMYLKNSLVFFLPLELLINLTSFKYFPIFLASQSTWYSEHNDDKANKSTLFPSIKIEKYNERDGKIICAAMCFGVGKLQRENEYSWISDLWLQHSKNHFRSCDLSKSCNNYSFLNGH